MEILKRKNKKKGKSLYEQRIIYPREMPWILRRHIYTGAMGTIYAWTISSIFLVPFATAVGMTESGWAFLLSLALLAHAMQLVSAHVTERIGRRKWIWFTSAFLSRLSCLIAAALALLIGYRWHLAWGDILVAPIVFTFFIVLLDLFGAIATPPWMSWLKDLVPRGSHATFMGRRSVWISLFVILVFIPIGYILDAAGKDYRVYGLFGVIVFGCVVGFIDLIIHRTIPEPRLRGKPSEANLLAKILEPFRHRRFRGWLIFNGYWNFAMFIGGSLCIVYFFKKLEVGQNFFMVTIVLIVLPQVGTAFTAGRIGALADRIGVRLPLRICYFLWATLPFFWIIATEETAFYLIAVSSFVGGLASTSAFNISTKITTRVAPAGKEAMFVAVSTFFSYVTASLGAFTGGMLIRHLADFECLFLGRELSGYHIIFLISAGLRLCSIFLVRLIPEPVRD